MTRMVHMRPPVRPLIAEDSGTVCHVWWKNGALVDTKGNAWTQNGTVPQVAKAGKVPAGAGPFSDAAFYSIDPQPDVLDFAVPFSVCVVFSYSVLPGAQQIFALNGADSASGYYFDTNALNAVRTVLNKAGSRTTVVTANAMVTGVNVLCGGWTGTGAIVKLNLGVIASTAFVGLVAGTTSAARIGDYPVAGLSMSGTVHELWFSTTTPSDALFIDIMNRVKSRAGVTAW